MSFYLLCFDPRERVHDGSGRQLLFQVQSKRIRHLADRQVKCGRQDVQPVLFLFKVLIPGENIEARLVQQDFNPDRHFR